MTLELLLAELVKIRWQGDFMMAELQALQAQVAANNAQVDAAIAKLAALTAQSVSAADLQTITASLRVKDDALAAAIAAAGGPPPAP